MSSCILIQGTFFQEQQWLGSRCVPKEGMVGVVERGTVRTMFGGVIFDDKDSAGELVGEMFDCYGDSDLFDVVLSPDKLSFSKRYTSGVGKNQPPIEYEYYGKESGIWIGKYSGEKCGTGYTYCSLVENVPEFIFDSGIAMVKSTICNARQKT